MEGALRAGLFEEATGFGDRLAAIAPNAMVRGEVQLAVVRALVLGRQFTAANERLGSRTPERLLQTPDAFKRELLWRIIKLRVARGRLEPAEDASLIEEADNLGDLELACEARMAMAGVLVGEEAMRLIGEAVSLSERLSPTLEFSARVLQVELIYASSPRDLHQAEVDLWRALSIAREISSIWQEVHIECDLAVLEAELGRADAAILRLTRLSAQAEALGMRSQLRTSLHNLATCLLRERRAHEAAEVAGRVASLAQDGGDPVLQAVALSLRSYALYQVGDLEEALASVTEAELLQSEREDRMLSMTLLRRAVILEALGRDDEALADAACARETALLHNEHGFYVTTVLWEKLFDARRGRIGATELREAISAVEASGVGQRALAQDLMQQAKAWLAEKTAPIVF
jgi:tetratricopeptide (TPR) repeat protein